MIAQRLDQIEVSIVEDSREMNQTMQMLLNGTPGFVCKSAHFDAESALDSILESPPDIVLIDLGLPGMSGQECIEVLKDKLPKLQFLVLTIKNDSEQVFSALKAGANGYLLKDASLPDILTAISELNDGGAPMSASIARKVVTYFQTGQEKASEYENVLTKREKEVLELLAKGKYYKEIADILYVSTETVKSHCHNIYEKLHVSSRTEALNKYYARH